MNELISWAQDHPAEFFEKYFDEITGGWGPTQWADLLRSLPKEAREAVVLQCIQSGKFKVTPLRDGRVGVGIRFKRRPNWNTAAGRIHRKKWKAYEKRLELWRLSVGNYIRAGEPIPLPPQPPKFHKNHVASVTALVVEHEDEA